MLNITRFSSTQSTAIKASSQVLSQSSNNPSPYTFPQDSFHQTKKEVKFSGLSDVVGMNDIKEQAQEQFIGPLNRQLNPSAFKKSNVKGKHPGGLLLYGEPGCGKTYFAEQIIDELKDVAPHVEISPTDRADHRVGMVESILKDKFDEAAMNRHSIVFIDEFDSLASKWHPENHADSNFHDNRRAAILTLLQKAPERGITVIGTSNKAPNELDDAVVRAGRMTVKLKVDRPDSEARFGLFKKAISDNLEPHSKFPISDSVLKKLAHQTEGLSSAEIISAVNVAANKALDRDEDLDMSHIEAALNKTIQKGKKIEVNSQDFDAYLRFESIKNQIVENPYYNDIYHGRLSSAMNRIPHLSSVALARYSRCYKDKSKEFEVSPALFACNLPASEAKRMFFDFLIQHNTQHDSSQLLSQHRPMNISPLMVLASLNDSVTVRKIVDWGWKNDRSALHRGLNCTDQFGKTAESYAREQGHLELADWLANKAASVSTSLRQEEKQEQSSCHIM